MQWKRDFDVTKAGNGTSVDFILWVTSFEMETYAEVN